MAVKLTTGTGERSRLAAIAATLRSITDGSGGSTAGSATMLKTKSMPGSSTTASRATSPRPAWAEPRSARITPVTSSGFWAAANGGSTARSRSVVAAPNSGITMPSSVLRSAMMSHAPPDAVTTPIRRPRGTCPDPSSPAVTSSSSRLPTRIAPNCRNAASTTASSPATAPVCASAVRCPASVRPTFSATIGFPAASAAAASAVKRGASRTDSRKSPITWQSSSAIRCSTTSAVVITASLPIEVSRLMPTWWARANARTLLVSAPLCSTMPTGPRRSGGTIPSPNGATEPAALTKPRQLGPSRVMSSSTARSTSRRSSARPASPPPSPYPEASTIALRIPAAAASSSTASTARVGART